MNLSEMRSLVRRDLHDEDAAGYRWSDDELDRHITRAVRDFSLYVPLPREVLLNTTAGSREIDISSLPDRVMVEAVEYPIDNDPKCFPLFSIRGDTITVIDDMPDGSACRIYYGGLHTIDAGRSTVPVRHEDIIAAGAGAYAALEWSVYAVNRVNIGGGSVNDNFLAWGRERMAYFRTELKRLGWKNRVRVFNITGTANDK